MSDAVLGNCDLEPAQGIGLVGYCLLEKDRQRFLEPLEKIQGSAKAEPVSIRLK